VRTYNVVVFASVFAPLLALNGCGGASGRATPKAAQNPQNFPVYTGTATQLFDDRIDPKAVGLADAAENPRFDATLKARTRTAEVVGRARVSTVSVDTVGGRPVYRLRFTFPEQPIVARDFDGGPIDVAVTDDSPAFGIVKWLDTNLIGHSFMAFFHRFHGGPGPEVRFHLSPDDPQVNSAVRDANAVSEVSRRR
jgi:hypothetical protein